MKILHLASTLDRSGGTEIYLRSLFVPLADLGHQNIVAVPGESLEEAPGISTPYALGAAPTRRLAEIVASERPEIAYLNGILPAGLIGAAARLLPTIAYIHDFHPVCPGLAKYLRASNTVCQQAAGWLCMPQIYLQRCASARHPGSVAAIIRLTKARLQSYAGLPKLLVASDYMAALLRQNGLPAERIEILPQFTPITGAAPPFPAGPAPRILFAGRLEPEKGLGELFEALRFLDGTDWRLDVAGQGSERARYEALAAANGWEDRVVFHGWVDEAGMRSLYAGARLVVMPSTWPEPFGRVGLDGLASGRPVVAYNVGGIASWLEDGLTGFLVEAHDISGFAVRIGMLLQDVALAARLGEAGVLDAGSRFSQAGHIRSLVSHFEALQRQLA